ncbi:RNA-binding protein 7 [Ceratina calcarata]|uniref:RNA-binding protein 7 n=1 Tax=Ceratina calcarata TaxID=156304 RepID=A0AAJ7J796_9HYME|nr:RNA-binding protein 7 [Ceratina calcarata]
MDQDIRTLWCGNLSQNVTEEILYELFLQGGPVQSVTIPKDRDGKQRAYAFITYKHVDSVHYALELFDGTALFNRTLNMRRRKNVDLPQISYPQDHSIQLNHWLQLGQEMLLGNVSHLQGISLGYANDLNMLPNINTSALTSLHNMKQTDNYSYKDDRRSRRAHPYHREQSKSNKESHHRVHNSRNHNRRSPPRRVYRNNNHSHR